MHRHQLPSTGTAGKAQTPHPSNDSTGSDEADQANQAVWQPTEIVEVRTQYDESAVKLPKIIPFETLSRCGDEVWIENGGQIYRLRKTKQGKLILTK